MYRDIREKESEEATSMIINICANLNSKNTLLSSPKAHNVTIQQPTIPFDPKKLTEDFKEIHPCPYQVWNCDDIGFDPKGSWLRVVSTYKFFMGKNIWTSQTGDRVPF